MRNPCPSGLLAAAARTVTALALFGCAARQPSAATRLADRQPAPRARERPNPAGDPFATPPPPGELPAVRLPAMGHVSVENGMKIRLVARQGEPLVELKFVVFSGTASDGGRPGLSALTGQLLKEGGAGTFDAQKLVERAESLGAQLEITTQRDSTSVAIRVATPDFEPALRLISDVVLRPRFARVEFEKLRTREVERTKNAERGDADWAALTLLYRRLFADPLGHPYAQFGATSAELEARTLEECRSWYTRHFVPENALLVVAGDVDPPAMGLRAKHAFERWAGAAPPPLAFPTPAPRLVRRVWVVDRPRAGQSEVYVAALGPERLSPSWPALAASSQILGGGVASRLFADVREKRSLAYHTSASIDELAHGPVPLVLSAGTRTSQTAAALEALLDNLNHMAQAPPAPWELAMAKRSITNGLLFRTERVEDLAELAAKLALLHLPDDYFQNFQVRLEDLDTTAVFATARQYYDVQNPVIVVAGDAAAVAESLRKFGNVEVVDPERDFLTVRALPRE